MKYLHWLTVITGCFLAHCFHWAARNEDRWSHLLVDRAMDGKGVASFFNSWLWFGAGGLLLWLGAAVLAWRLKTVERLSEALVRAAYPYWILWGGLLAPALIWAPMRGWPDFLLRTAGAASFIAMLIYSLKFNIPVRAAAARPLWREPGWMIPIVLLLVLFSVDRMLTGFWRYWSFNAGLDDLGLYNQMLWGWLHGHPYWTTIYNYDNHCFLSEHVMLSVGLLAPLYLICASPIMLYIAQSVIILSGGAALVLIARERTRTAWFPLLAVIVFLLYPPLERGWVKDFHSDTMEVGFYLLAYWFFLKRWHVPYWIILVCLLGCKEDVGLAVGALGFWMAVCERRWRTGVATMLLGGAWSVVCIKFVLPWMAGADQNVQMNNYAYLGKGMFGIVTGIFLRPHNFLYHLFQPERVESLLKVFLPLAFLAGARPVLLLLPAPFVLTTIMSGWEPQYALTSHYGLVFVGPAFVGLIEGWRALEERWERRGVLSTRSLAWGAALLICAGTANIEYAKFPVDSPLKWTKTYRIPKYRPQVTQTIFEAIPPEGRISVQNGIGTPLSYRQWIYKFPQWLDGVDYVVLDTKSARAELRPEDIEAVSDLFSKKDFGIAAKAESVFLMRRGVHTPNEQKDIESLTSALKASGAKVKKE